MARDKRSRVHGRREREPWLLASNLPEAQWNAAQVVEFYKRRMQIEEGFRDVKSAPLGLGLDRHRSHCPKRIEVLLLIAALANYLILLMGLRVRQLGHERRFQSNSLRHKRILSLWRLGLEYGRKHATLLSWSVLEDLEHRLRYEAQQQSLAVG